eukprot:Nk52_evm2s1128 gene=Nk52_evmTU2s1128
MDSNIFCQVCEEEINREVKYVSATGKNFHVHCFLCCECLCPLSFESSSRYFEHDGRHYCMRDYQWLFASRCYTCSKFIQGKCITFKDKKYHCEHFVCDICGEGLSENTNLAQECDVPICPECFRRQLEEESAEKERQSVICPLCREVLGEFSVTMYRGNKVHSVHLKCHVCEERLTDGNTFEFTGKMYCRKHYDERSKLKDCFICKQPVESRMVTARGRHWHKDCFKCQVCTKMLANERYYVEGGKPYCKRDYDLQFGPKCFDCGGSVGGEKIEVLYKVWDKDHFRCFCCDIPFSQLKLHYLPWDNKPLCKPCFKALPSSVQDKLQKVEKEEVKQNKKK